MPTKPLTETELEMMQVIWRLGSCSVRQILDELPKDRPLAYTSVSTIVRILEQKGFVTSSKAGRGHLYSPIVSKESYQAQSVDHIVDSVFDGAPAELVRHLLSSKSLSAADLKEIESLLAREE
jgi:predicted transcriptional regulator